MENKLTSIFNKIHNYSVLVSSGIETNTATRIIFGDELAEEVKDIDKEIEILRNKFGSVK